MELESLCPLNCSVHISDRPSEIFFLEILIQNTFEQNLFYFGNSRNKKISDGLYSVNNIVSDIWQPGPADSSFRLWTIKRCSDIVEMLYACIEIEIFWKRVYSKLLALWKTWCHPKWISGSTGIKKTDWICDYVLS